MTVPEEPADPAAQYRAALTELQGRMSPQEWLALERALSRVPQKWREDAIQEAWVAFLEKKNPSKAVRRFVKGEVEYAKRHVSLPENYDVIDRRSL